MYMYSGMNIYRNSIIIITTCNYNYVILNPIMHIHYIIATIVFVCHLLWLLSM